MSSDTKQTRRSSRWTSGLRPTLPGTDYHDPKIFELERERIFHAKWVCVGREEQVAGAGDYLVREIIDESILIVRNRTGELRAFYNVCRHRGSQLCDNAQGNVGGAIQCPYHAWTYSLDGRLRGTPHVGKVEGFDKADYPLHAVAVDTWGGFVFVNLAKEPGSLLEQLTYLPTDFARYRLGELRVGHVIEYDVAANWKVIAENYSECLHCPVVHPELCEIVPLYRRGLVLEDDTDWGNRMIEGATTFTDTGRSNLPPLPGLTEEDKVNYYGGIGFPNLILNFHSDHVMTYILKDIAPERTTVVSEFLFRESTLAMDSFDPSEVVKFWDRVGRQDWEVCERVQRGVRSRAFGRGVYPPPDVLAHDFNQRYLRERGDP